MLMASPIGLQPACGIVKSMFRYSLEIRWGSVDFGANPNLDLACVIEDAAWLDSVVFLVDAAWHLDSVIFLVDAASHLDSVVFLGWCARFLATGIGARPSPATIASAGRLQRTRLSSQPEIRFFFWAGKQFAAQRGFSTARWLEPKYDMICSPEFDRKQSAEWAPASLILSIRGSEENGITACRLRISIYLHRRKCPIAVHYENPTDFFDLHPYLFRHLRHGCRPFRKMSMPSQ
jgi:hypothetical protein